MGLITYVRAHVLHNTDAMVELAKKDAYDITKVESHIAKKLEKIYNSDKKYNLQKAENYQSMLDVLNSKKGAAIYRPLNDTLIQNSQNVSPEITNKSQSAEVVNSSANAKKKLPPEIMAAIRKPEAIAETKQFLATKIDKALNCQTYEAMEKDTLRTIMTHLTSVFMIITDEEAEQQLTGLMREDVADVMFSQYGSRELESDEQLKAVQAHIIKIQQFLQQQNLN